MEKKEERVLVFVMVGFGGEIEVFLCLVLIPRGRRIPSFEI